MTIIRGIDTIPHSKFILSLIADRTLIDIINDREEHSQLSSILTMGGHYVKFLDNPCFKVQLLSVLIDGYNIEHITEPCEDIQLAAVSQYGGSILFIDNPSYTIQLAALNENGFAIKHIENQTLELQLVAVNNNPRSLIYIRNPYDKVLTSALLKDSSLITLIPENKRTNELILLSKLCC
jgi:hypothetical protein